MRSANLVPTLFFASFGVSLAACGSDAGDPSRPPTSDAGTDAGTDAPPDSPADRQPDTTPDAIADGMPESAPDGALEAGADTSVDVDGSVDAGGDGSPAFEQVELLDDNRFLEGFNTYPVNPSATPIGSLVPPTATGSPVWRLAEWYTQQLLANVPPTMTAWGAEWANAYKRVVIGDGFLELAVDADAEWGGQYRQAGEPWPHLLVAQEIYEDSAASSNTPIYQYESVTLSLDLEIVHTNHIQEAGYDPGLHACQFLMYITLQNRDQTHDDYGNFIWFGLPFYDDRYASVDENIAVDSGTGKYMFRMASESFMPQSLHDVDSVSVAVDLLSFMKTAVQDAIAQGILTSPDLDDYFLGGMNMGFEVPGRSVATIRVRDLSLLGERAIDP